MSNNVLGLVHKLRLKAVNILENARPLATLTPCALTFITTTKNARSEKRFPDSSITLTPAANADGANSAVEIKSIRKRVFAERSGIA